MGRTLNSKKSLADPGAAKIPVPALSWDQKGLGASAVKRVPTYMAKRLQDGARKNFGDMLAGGDKAEAVDSKTAAEIAAKAGGTGDGEFL